jgi:opacity protein-like surface antigen
MKIKLLVAAAATVVASSAMAQSAFQGFYGQIGAGYETNDTQSSTTTFTTVPAGFGSTYNNPSVNFSNAPIIAGLGYTFSLSKQYTLGLGADYSFITGKSGNFTSTSPSPDADPNVSYFKTSNRLNVFLTPGFIIDKDKLAYLKAGYSSQKLESFTANTNASEGSANVSGYILGVGYKQMINSGLYGFGEANYMSYSKANISSSGACNELCSTYTGSASIPSSAYNFLVGVGYKF